MSVLLVVAAALVTLVLAEVSYRLDRPARGVDVGLRVFDSESTLTIRQGGPARVEVDVARLLVESPRMTSTELAYATGGDLQACRRARSEFFAATDGRVSR